MSEEDTSRIGQHLREVRGGMSQAEFAEILGVHQNTIVNYESGKRLPDAAVISRLFKKMNVDPTWLITGSRSSVNDTDSNLALLKEFRDTIDRTIANLEKGRG